MIKRFMLQTKLKGATGRIVAFAVTTFFLLLPLHVHAQAQKVTREKTVAPTAPALAASPARVAVFGEPGFPSFLDDDKATLPPPNAIVARLESLGIAAEVVHADTLADGTRFDAQHYRLLVLPYGNCYPMAALQNLQTFHRENGGFVLTGIPFTHPVVIDPGAIEDWNAVPGWGELARVAPGAGQHGGNALLLHGRASDAVWVGSPHFPVHTGEKIRLSARFKDQGDKPVGEGHFFLRFWDAGNNYIGQVGLTIPYAPDWQSMADTFPVPDKAVAADVSPQIWNDSRRALLVAEPAVTAEGQAVSAIPLLNGTFARGGDRWRDTGDGGKDAALFGPNGVGVGSCAGADVNAKPYIAAPDDPLAMASLNYAWSQANRVRWLDPASLPKTDTIIPLVGTRERPVAALVVHHSDDYRGVVDAWVYKGPGGELDIAGTGQMIVRGVVAALHQQGYLSDARVKSCYAALDRLAGVGNGNKAAKRKTSP